MTRQHIRKTLLEEYDKSPFHKSECLINLELSAKNCYKQPSFPPELVDNIEKIINVRGTMPLLNLIIRRKHVNNVVCAPHVMTRFENVRPIVPILEFKDKWNITEKISANLAQTLLYSSIRCKQNKTKFKGVLLEFLVNNGNHSNFIYIDIIQSPFVCYLFEPNGIQYLKTTGARTDLENAIKEANNILIGSFSENVEIADIKGVQFELGFEQNENEYRGIGICRAVTFWTIFQWVQSDILDFKQFIYTLAQEIHYNTIDRRQAIIEFMKYCTTSLTQKLPNGYTVFENGMVQNLKKDIQHILTYYNCSCEYEQLNIRINFKAGPHVTFNETLTFEQCAHN